MATISLSSRFRLTLLQISDLLGRKETNIHDVLSLCTYISPEKSEQINNAEDLFDVLQDLNLLNERKVDELIDLLDKFKLPQASELLKNYKKSNLNGMKFSEFFSVAILIFFCDANKLSPDVSVTIQCHIFFGNITSLQH